MEQYPPPPPEFQDWKKWIPIKTVASRLGMDTRDLKLAFERGIVTRHRLLKPNPPVTCLRYEPEPDWFLWEPEVEELLALPTSEERRKRLRNFAEGEKFVRGRKWSHEWLRHRRRSFRKQRLPERGVTHGPAPKEPDVPDTPDMQGVPDHLQDYEVYRTQEDEADYCEFGVLEGVAGLSWPRFKRKVA